MGLQLQPPAGRANEESELCQASAIFQSLRKGNRSKNRQSGSCWLKQAHLERRIQEIKRSINECFNKDFPSGSALGLNLPPPSIELTLDRVPVHGVPAGEKATPTPRLFPPPSFSITILMKI